MKYLYVLGTKMSGKTNNHGINDKSEASSDSSPSNVMKAPIKHAASSCEETSLKMPNLTKNDMCNDIPVIEILSDDNYDNEQPAISAVSNEISRNVSIAESSSEVEFTTSPKVTIYQYRYENNIHFLKLKKIVFKHNPSSSKTFKKLVYTIKNSFNFELPKVININYNWHSPNMRVIQKLLEEILQTINQTKYEIIHFMTFLNLLFRKSVNTDNLSIVETYHSFFRFTDFINRCLLLQNNIIFMKWLPMVWNNSFYYGLILVEYILYNNFERKINYKSFHTLLEWSHVPDIQKLFKILSYDNKCRSEKIKYMSNNNNNYMKLSNILKSEHQDEPPKKKIKLTSDQQAQKSEKFNTN